MKPVSNNHDPVSIENGDRRFVVYDVSSEKKGDFEYFDALGELIKRDCFKQHLLTYYMNRDISSWNKRRLPCTDAKNLIQQASKSSYQLFVEEHYNEFNIGFNRSLAYDAYKIFVSDNGFKLCNVTTFKTNVLRWCDEKQKRFGCKRDWCYVLKDEYMDMFKEFYKTDDEALNI